MTISRFLSRASRRERRFVVVAEELCVVGNGAENAEFLLYTYVHVCLIPWLLFSTGVAVFDRLSLFCFLWWAGGVCPVAELGVSVARLHYGAA